MPASVVLSPLFDPTLERVGFPLDHPYVEHVYCSVLGPSSVLLLRRAGQLFAEHPEGLHPRLVELSRSLGLGARPEAEDVGRNSPPRRTMNRLVRFRMAEWRGDDHLGVQPKVPALERHRIERLPRARANLAPPAPDRPPGGACRPGPRGGTSTQSARPGRWRRRRSTCHRSPARLRPFGSGTHEPRAIAG